jgi:hypothetical protein
METEPVPHRFKRRIVLAVFAALAAALFGTSDPSSSTLGSD